MGRGTPSILAAARLASGGADLAPQPNDARPLRTAHSRALLELAVRLEAVERPVSPAGIVLAQRLLRDGAGPFFDPDRADELGPALHAALDALEPDLR